MTQENQAPAEELAAPSSADSILAVMRFLRVVWQRRIYVVSTLVVAGLLGGLYYFTADRIYQATAQLLILQTGPDMLSPTMAGATNREALIPTYERLFSSTVVLEGAIIELLKAPPQMRVDFASVPREKWLDVLRTNLSASALRRTNVIEVSYRSRDPKAAEAVVQAAVQSYLQFMERNHKNVSAEIVQILEKERVEISQQLDQRQRDMITVQKKVRDMGLSGKQDVVHPAVQRVMRLNESLVKVQQDRLQLEASLAAIHSAVREGADLRQHLNDIEPLIGREMMLSALGLNTQDAEARASIERRMMEDRAKIQTLLEHYGELHPKVMEVAQSIRGAEEYLKNYQSQAEQRLSGLDDKRLGSMLVSMVEERLGGLWEHENKLSRQYAQAEEEAVQLNDRMAELRMVEHDLTRLRNLHDGLLARINNIDIGKDQTDLRVAVVSEPKASNRPVSPRLSLVGMMCLLGGLGVGVALVYVLDVLDDRFRSPEELQEQLRVPVLAMIRQLSSPQASGLEAIQVHVAPESVESEAFRTLRTTLAFSGQDMDRIAITSTEPGDGKTTVISNLAVSYAHAGKRTLLIDCDLRRPGLTKLFELRGSGGVSEILRSDQDIAALCDERVQGTGIDGLEILPCGPKPSNPAELLSGPRLSDLLAWAETHYDQILVDCPPIMAASDAAIVGRLTDSLILVVQPEKNHRRLVLRAVNGLAAIGVHIGGVVANRISTEKNSGYYGYGGYGYGYGYGENQDGEENDPLPSESSQRLRVATEAVTDPNETAQGEPSNKSTSGRVKPRRAA
jgi:capsular exopolysaccharide synthesis family protein